MSQGGRFRGGLVFKAQRRVCLSTLGSGVTKKKEEQGDLRAFLHPLKNADSLERSAHSLIVKFEGQILPENPALYGIWGART